MKLRGFILSENSDIWWHTETKATIQEWDEALAPHLHLFQLHMCAVNIYKRLCVHLNLLMFLFTTYSVMLQ